ncbi:MAG: HsmA family protein [Coriobacteriia bacterium]
MSTTLLVAIISMLLAATLYTIAVFSERAAGILKPWHLGLFWLGLAFDTFGTTLMSRIAGGWKWDIHGVIGLTAVALMLIHSMWATVALVFKQENVLRSFRKFSVHVWALWMAAFISGIVLVALG